MTHPTPHNSTILSLIKGIRILSFNGKEITRIEKKGRAKP